MKPDPIIRIDGVTFSYNGAEAVRDVSLRVGRGAYIGIIGPNGSGKTTLLRLMLGLLEPAKGTVQVLEGMTGKARVGYIPQKATQLETMFPITVEEVVGLGLVAKKGVFSKLTKADRETIDHALKQVDLRQLKKKQIHDLSGGQQQRALIAKALVSDPDVLMLDEPTVGIDSSSQDSFYELLIELNKDGKTIILVSHDIAVVANEVQTLACLNKTLVYHGSPKKFIAGDYIEKVYGKDRTLILHDH